ncbi:SPRY domain-containing protein [Paenibacillus sp. CFBP 13594]|uniref:SPRY domain-containing protein n=1 Tax=Paenibacillus sp. CFBP 13594 TaxID=2774037 RepID=UPI001A7E6F60|nr:SPRY domain-containing protein [Paenibacillus sp. CFBP 13594]
MNPQDATSNWIFSEGNLKLTSTSGTGSVRATHGKSTGKWYWEATWLTGSALVIGVANQSQSLDTLDFTNANTTSRSFSVSGSKVPNNTSFGSAFAVNDVLSVLMDMDNGNLEFWRNGVTMGISHTDLKQLGKLYPFTRTGGTGREVRFNFGNTPFAYNIPSGYTAFVNEVLSSVLVRNNNNYYKLINNIWTFVSSEPIEDNYLSGNTLAEISSIPASAWSQLQGEVELCYYTDDPTKTEASFNIETEPFTLAEEWEDKEIKIIEYTDDPNQTESTITIETEPFTIYDELGDSVDVLYYTDDPSKTSAELNITANYSPLDELEGDFDVVTWSDNNNPKIASTSSIPSPQSIIQTDDYNMYGDILSIVDKLNSTNGTLRYAVSFNEGNTWEVCKFGKWRTIDISSLATFKKSGMSHYDIALINSTSLKNKGNQIRFAYYIEDNIHNSDTGIAIDNMKLNINSATETIKIDNVAFYVLNTNATIQLSLTGSKLTGTLDDSDQGKVQYRILLNDNPYYPSDGSFTRLAPSPQDIDINISDRDVIFNQPNVLKVEFQDYWGETDYWETTFVGTYSGLMFMDESGEYLSDTFGGILKQLDFGVIIAGQTTLTQKVRIKNQLGYAIDNVYLAMDKKYVREGVVVELSRQANPFLPIDYLTYGLTQPDETIDFYVRIATDMRAQPNPNGLFELVVNADRV